MICRLSRISFLPDNYQNKSFDSKHCKFCNELIYVEELLIRFLKVITEIIISPEKIIFVLLPQNNCYRKYFSFGKNILNDRDIIKASQKELLSNIIQLNLNNPKFE